ncbi:MAG: V-type ATP synthase subunit D [Thermodesulfobacteriota bacterium]
MKRLQLNKTELRNQKENLARYGRYLPLLEVKKRQLQQEADLIRSRIREVIGEMEELRKAMAGWVALLGEDVGLKHLVRIETVRTGTDNVTGIDVPVFQEAVLARERYDLFVFPVWVDAAVAAVARLLVLRAEKGVLDERHAIITRELRITTQRVNLFERVKIPEARERIHRIQIRLADQQASAMGWARMAKSKLAEARTS